MTLSMIKKKDAWKNILQLNKVGDTKKNGRNSMDKGGSPGTNPGEPGVGMEWTSDYHKMQEKNPNQHSDSPQRI